MAAVNPFEAFADTYTPRPVKAKRRPVGGRDMPAKDKRLEERSRLAAQYEREEARRVAEALASRLRANAWPLSSPGSTGSPSTTPTS